MAVAGDEGPGSSTASSSTGASGITTAEGKAVGSAESKPHAWHWKLRELRWTIVGSALVPEAAHLERNVTHHLASRLLSAGGASSDPTAPLAPLVSKKAIKATRAVRTPQLGCQLWGWKEEMDRQMGLLVSKRPEGVRR
jgi:hypothetical protein